MPVSKKYKVDKDEENPIYFGVEIEGANSDYNNLLDRLQRIAGDERYSSTHDGGGAEIALQPATLAYLKQSKVLTEILEEYKRSGSRMDDSGGTGIHIHVGKEYFTSGIFLKMWKLVCDNQESFRLLFRRLPGGYGLQGIPTFLSGMCGTQKPMDQEVAYIETALKGTSAFHNINSNFQINRKSIPTIEFRLFQSTSSKDVLLAYVEILHSLYNYTKSTSLITFIGYKNYLLKNIGIYGELVQLMKDLKIPIKARKRKAIDPIILKTEEAARKKAKLIRFKSRIRSKVLQAA
jgi:hypothetical protein